MHGYAEIIRHLAMARADLNARCTTALLQAAYVGSVDPARRAPCAVVLALLRELGAEEDKTDCWGKTAVDYCRGVPELELAIGAELLAKCPYTDCGRSYRVWRKDYRGRVVRCGCAWYNGREYQLPKHGSRREVRRWLQESWGWQGWPGEILGCGRPLKFPDESGTALFVTWADEVTGTVHPSSVDVDGDYSMATRDLGAAE